MFVGLAFCAVLLLFIATVWGLARRDFDGLRRTGVLLATWIALVILGPAIESARVQWIHRP